MNKIFLIGRIVIQPEIKYTPGNIPVCNFRIAVKRRYKDEKGNIPTDFIDCSAWRNQAEFLCQYINKGQLVAIDGTLQNRDYVNANGERRRIYEVLTENIQLLEKSQKAPQKQTEEASAPPDPFTEL